MAPVLAFGFILLTTIKGDFGDLAGGFPAVATCSSSFDIDMPHQACCTSTALGGLSRCNGTYAIRWSRTSLRRQRAALSCTGIGGRLPRRLRTILHDMPGSALQTGHFTGYGPARRM